MSDALASLCFFAIRLVVIVENFARHLVAKRKNFEVRSSKCRRVFSSKAQRPTGRKAFE